MPVCMCKRVCACKRMRDVFAIYENNISPRLIMIIIKIIILYFIQIRHTDDSPQRVPDKYNSFNITTHWSDIDSPL